MLKPEYGEFLEQVKVEYTLEQKVDLLLELALAQRTWCEDNLKALTEAFEEGFK